MKGGLKNNRFIRGIYFFFRSFWGFPQKDFGYMAESVVITPPFYFGNKKNIFIYERVGIGPNCYISATNSKCIIRGNTAIAENVTIHTGNHANVIGMFVTDVNEVNKPTGFDKDVIIEHDVWVGCNVTILAGVQVGRGAIIAAGAVVNKNIVPYGIYGGIPARFIKFRWTIDEVLEHEKMLYKKEDRFTIAELKKMRKEYLV